LHVFYTNPMESKRFFLYDLLAIIFVLSFISCSYEGKTGKLLTSAETMVEQYPDSALILLDSIINPYDLSPKELNRYRLLQIQAKDKAWKDISSDTVIFDVRNYYVKKNDPGNIALSTFYCGRVLHERRDYIGAMKEYLKADEYAEKTRNTNLKGLSQSFIGEVNLKKMAPDKAVEHFKTAAQDFHEANNMKNETGSYIFIGNAFLQQSAKDSALYYYDKALQVAEANNDSLQIEKIAQNIGIAYQESGRIDQAEKYFGIAAKYISDSKDRMKLYLNISDTFYERGILDSAKVYVNKSLSLLPNNPDIFVAASIYETLSEIEEKQSDFKQSLEYFKEYADNLKKIVEENKKNEISELQRKYDKERFQNENSQLKISKQRLYILFSTALLMICLLALFFYKKSADNKKRVMEKEYKILEAEKKIYQLMEMANSYKNKENSDRDLLLQHFEILKKVSLLKKSLKNKEDRSHHLVKVFNTIVYGQESLNWNIFIQSLNGIHNGLFNRLKERYPELTETEFRICCLTYSDFSCSEIGTIINLSPFTVQQKRSILRKKLGIEPEGDIRSYLDNTLSEKKEPI